MAGCGGHGDKRSAATLPVTTPSTMLAPTTIRTGDRRTWVRKTNAVCAALFKAARASAEARLVGPSSGDIVDPASETQAAGIVERAATALATIAAPVEDRAAIARAVAALHQSATHHEHAATAKSAPGDDDQAITDYDAALDSEERALSILSRLGARVCRVK
jgi:hypothetical protein